jgi:hypothetical protein
LRRTAAVTAVTIALCSPAAADAGAYRVAIVVEPTYTFCLSGPACTSAGRTSFAAEYKPIVNKKLDLRIKISRAFVRSDDEDGVDDIYATADQRYQAAADSVNLRIRMFDADGYERQEPRAGYSYQHPTGASDVHHTFFASDALFFGPQILRGMEAPAHFFRVQLKFSKDAYEPAGVAPQTFLQATAAATFPLVPSGMWRAEAGFTAQKQLAGYNGFSVFSTRYSATLTHDFSAAVRAYARIQTADTTNLIAGMRIFF